MLDTCKRRLGAQRQRVFLLRHPIRNALHRSSATGARRERRTARPPLLFVAPRSAFQVLDDWGELTGLVGSGSNSIVFDNAVVPWHWVLENTHMADVDWPAR